MKDIDTLEEGDVAMATMTVWLDIQRKGHPPPPVEERTLIVGRLRKEPTSTDIAELLQKAIEMLNGATTEGDNVLIGIPAEADPTRFRKLTEGCWTLLKAKGTAEISTKAGRAKRRERRKLTTVSVGLESRTFAEVLKSLQEKVKQRTLGVDIRGYFQAGQEVCLQITERTRGGRERLRAFIEETLTYKTAIRGSSLSAAIMLTGLEPLLDEGEVAQELNTILRHKEPGQLKVEKIGRNRRGTRVVVVRLTQEDADRLLKMRNAQIGWSLCHIYEWLEVLRCSRCQKAGHRAATCEAEEEKAKRCYHCGLFGLHSKDCKTKVEDYFCVDCQLKGHSGHCKGCPIYRELLAALKTSTAAARQQGARWGTECHKWTR